LQNQILKINSHAFTLVDQVEEKLYEYIKSNELVPGDLIPHERKLAESLGVARGVLREALSRLKMLGVVDSRSRRGMVLCEPNLLGGLERVVDPRILSKKKILEILSFRIMLETGISDLIFSNVSKKDIEELENIVERHHVLDNNIFQPEDDSEFHTKLFEISGNQMVIQFQKIILPVYYYIRDNFDSFFDPFIKTTSQDELISHKHLVDLIKKGDSEKYNIAMKKHLELYTHFLNLNKA
jgi:GntR family transcriptional regulator, transcriptional repressor for pyruvate dehydrogenase complex